MTGLTGKPLPLPTANAYRNTRPASCTQRKPELSRSKTLPVNTAGPTSTAIHFNSP